jgi:receptor protein-tyrosine kinase
MSIIEQATRRLEQLEQAGLAVPWATATAKAATVRALPRVEPIHPELRDQPAGTASGARRPRVELDLDALKRFGWLGEQHAGSSIPEEFRQIKRPLLRHARGADAADGRRSMIMVTSALPGEGKTFTAINLAMSCALEIDTSVLLVDADVLRGELPRRLGFDADEGLLDLLADPSRSWSDLVCETNVPKLSILTAGRRSAVSTELLASDAMAALLDSLAADGRDRIVIFDAPPLLVTSEAKVLASWVGQVLLVVEAAATPRRAVAQALTELEKCPLVMSVLNKSSEARAPYGYGEYAG